MNAVAIIQNDAAVKALSDMAKLYGYELVPAVPAMAPVIDMQAGPKTLSKKKHWTNADTRAAIAYCEEQGLKVSSLIPFLKSTIR